MQTVIVLSALFLELCASQSHPLAVLAFGLPSFLLAAFFLTLLAFQCVAFGFLGFHALCFLAVASRNFIVGLWIVLFMLLTILAL